MTVKELKTNNMGYTPYKMNGHELKGIKQRGVPFTGGVGSREDRTGVADTINPSPNTYNASPSKFLMPGMLPSANIFQKFGKKAADMMSGGKDKLKSLMEKMQGKAQAKAGGGGAMNTMSMSNSKRISALENQSGGVGGGPAGVSSNAGNVVAGLAGGSANPTQSAVGGEKEMWGGVGEAVPV